MGGPFVDVSTNQGYDNMSQPEMQITIQGNYELIDMQREIKELKENYNLLMLQIENEMTLRNSNPALKDLYDQYQVVYTLVKKAEEVKNSS